MLRGLQGVWLDDRRDASCYLVTLDLHSTAAVVDIIRSNGKRMQMKRSLRVSRSLSGDMLVTWGNVAARYVLHLNKTTGGTVRWLSCDPRKPDYVWYRPISTAVPRCLSPALHRLLPYLMHHGIGPPPGLE